MCSPTHNLTNIFHALHFITCHQSLRKVGVNDDGIAEIIAEVDKDGNGTIDYNEFCLMMRNL